MSESLITPGNRAGGSGQWSVRKGRAERGNLPTQSVGGKTLVVRGFGLGEDGRAHRNRSNGKGAPSLIWMRQKRVQRFTLSADV